MSEAAPEATPDQTPAASTEGTILSGDTITPVAAPQTWPDTWRNDLAGDDSKELERLGRFSSVNEIYKSFRSMESEFSNRPAARIEFDAEMPDNKMEEYRKQEGIPATAKDYNLDFDDGLVIGETDKPLVDGFLEFAHSKNMPEAHAKEAVRWYLEDQVKGEEEYNQKVADGRHETLALLKAEYGPEFDGNINAMNELYVNHPEIKDVLMGAIGSDGLPIGNNDQVVRWAIDLAKQLNPAATVILPGGESGQKGLESRINEIEQTMKTDRDAYDRDQSMQDEYEDLLDKRDRLANR